jgi:hypothetical protein
MHGPLNVKSVDFTTYVTKQKVQFKELDKLKNPFYIICTVLVPVRVYIPPLCFQLAHLYPFHAKFKKLK